LHLQRAIAKKKGLKNQKVLSKSSFQSVALQKVL